MNHLSFVFIFRLLQINFHSRLLNTKKEEAIRFLLFVLFLLLRFFCGKRGIRTPGTSQFNGFQDRRVRPLRHLSFPHKRDLFTKPAAKVLLFFDICNIYPQKNLLLLKNIVIL